MGIKLELGAGHRGTRGYVHHDRFQFPGISITGDPWDLNYPDGSLDEVLALAFIEHLTFGEAYDTFRNVYRMLKSGKVFLFDVPDYPVWAQYYLDALAGKPTPLPMDHISKTLFGWQRWPGDEHKSGWDQGLLEVALEETGFTLKWGSTHFLAKGLYRRRFTKPEDAHLYVTATK